MANDFYLPLRKDLKWLAVDLDGTLCNPTWEPGITKEVVGDVIPENLDKLHAALNAGYKAHIHTSRPWSHFELIEAWLKHNDIPYDGIVCGKVLAHKYIDDKGVNASEDRWF